MEQLAIRDFRLVAKAELDLHPGTNLLVGENAQGKTSVLEAIAMLSLGRSFRAARDRECIARAASAAARFASIDARYTEHGLPRRLRLAIEPTKKTVYLDGKQLRALSELWGHVRTVLFAPSDLRLVSGGPELRRGVLDTVLGQVRPGYLKRLGSYQRALQNRNGLIRDRVAAGDGRYAAFEATMAEAAALVAAERAQLVPRLDEAAREAVAALTDGREALRLTHEPGSLARDKALATEALAAGEHAAIAAAFAECWRRERQADIDRGFTRQGPHRDDLRFDIDGHDARAYASQGQARTCALALRLAELQVHEREGGEKPILLLDDILGELDRQRTRGFLRLVATRKVQTVLTATDAQPVEEGLDVHRRFLVRSGIIGAQ